MERGPGVAAPGQSADAQPQPAPGTPRAPGVPGLISIAKHWLWVQLLVEGVILGTVGSALNNAITSHIPSEKLVSDFVHAYPLATLVVIACGIVGTAAVAFIVWRQPAAVRQTQLAAVGLLQKPTVALGSITLASMSTLLLVTLLMLLAIHPSWCPNQVCAAGLAAYPWPTDGYVGVDIFAVQSDTILIQGNPADFSLAHLPDTRGSGVIGAVLVQSPTGSRAPANLPYRIAVHVQNLRSDMGELSIESIALVVTRDASLGHVNAWLQGAAADYQQNPFVARYEGERSGETIPALYAGAVPFSHVRLNPGETDTVTVRVWSGEPADVSYRLQITYRYLNEGNPRTFEDPQTVEVVFASRLQWTEYELKAGKLQPV